MKEKCKKLWELFWTFFKIGAFTFGGGYAMIPLIQQETVENHHWLGDEDILEIVAISESTPGPISLNAATFIGYRTAGILGAVCATMGTVLPSFLIILAISYVLREFQQIKAVQFAFQGIRAGVLALLIKALIKMYKSSPKGWAAYVVMAASFLLVAFLQVPVLAVIVGCAVFGLVTSLLARRKEGAK